MNSKITPLKKTYRKPLLKKQGSVKSLTKALKTGSNVDGFGGSFV